MNHCLRAELIEMQDEDQRLRWRALEAEGEPAAAAWAAVGELDRRHTIRMREIVAEHGWPGLTLVGVDGAHAAWLLAQHADHDHDFQRECLVLLDAAVDAGEAEAIDQAYLEDRVAVAEDRPQRYGTQFRRGGEGFVPAPIVDDKDVDQRRAALGLCPLAEYAASINQPRQSRKV